MMLYQISNPVPIYPEPLQQWFQMILHLHVVLYHSANKNKDERVSKFKVVRFTLISVYHRGQCEGEI